MNEKLFDYIAACPTQYHTAAHTAQILSENGFIQLYENSEWDIEKGKSYYVLRNGSSIIAFRLNDSLNSFMLTATHGDTPSFRIKENSMLESGPYKQLSVEKYGGPLLSSWFDRPLSVAGRVTVEGDNGILVKNVDIKKPVAVIPNVAVHFDHKNEYDLKCDLLPIITEDITTLLEEITDTKKLISTELYLYNPQPGVTVGQYIIAPRLDNLMCTFASLSAFLAATPKATPVMCIFDNEEVGSTTKQGAASTFLFDVLTRIAQFYGVPLSRILPDSMLLSCDNGHALHPNHPELHDKNHSAHINGGIIIKHNANQKYTTDGLSSGIIRYILNKANVPYQDYANRADLRGGSTLGNILTTQVSVNMADIGLAQLAMHSICETAGAEDTAHMYSGLKAFFETRLQASENGIYNIF